MKKAYWVTSFMVAVALILGMVTSLTAGERWSKSRWSGQDNLVVDNLVIAWSSAFVTMGLTATVTGNFGTGAIAVVCWADTADDVDSTDIWVTSLTGTTLTVGRLDTDIPATPTFNYLVKRTRTTVR